MDDSGDGLLSEDEMSFGSTYLDCFDWKICHAACGFKQLRMQLLMNPKVQAYLQSMDLDVAEGQALFQLLQNGHLGWLGMDLCFAQLSSSGALEYKKRQCKTSAGILRRGKGPYGAIAPPKTSKSFEWVASNSWGKPREMISQSRVKPKSSSNSLDVCWNLSCFFKSLLQLHDVDLDTFLLLPHWRLHSQNGKVCGAYAIICHRVATQGEGMVTYEDFIDGILRCKGPARAIDQPFRSNKTDGRLLNEWERSFAMPFLWLFCCSAKG